MVDGDGITTSNAKGAAAAAGNIESKRASSVVRTSVPETIRSIATQDDCEAVTSTIEETEEFSGEPFADAQAPSSGDMAINTNASAEKNVQPLRKSSRTKSPSVRLSTPGGKDAQPTPSPVSAAAVYHSNRHPKTTQELYNQIKKSNDKLFFIAYSHGSDPRIHDNSKEKKGIDSAYKWFLVRVDLKTCQELDITEDCHKTGKYYVEFYLKASYDRGVLLPGNPKENGVPSSKMKPKADSDSRYWLEWHEYHYDKNENMILGNSKEFIPNSKKAILRRLRDLAAQRIRQPGSSSTSSGSSSEGEERLMAEYHPDFDKYTTWADTIDLMDGNTRLVGPFDFDDVKPPPLMEDDMKMLNDEMRALFVQNYVNLHVKDRVPLKRWQQLAEALKGRDIDPPSIPEELQLRKKKKKEMAGSKRGREKLSGQVAQPASRSIIEKNTAEPLLRFPATASRATLKIKKGDTTVVSKDRMKDELLSLVEASLSQTRCANSEQGQTYFVSGEVKETLNQLLGFSKGGSAKTESSAESIAEPLQGLLESDFTQEEIESMPVAFAYSSVDPSGASEENAKIATLEIEVEQRRLKRIAAQSNSSGLSKGRSNGGRPKTTPPHPVLTEKDKQRPPEPVEGFPDGWLLRKFPRNTGTHIDKFYYSPKLNYKFNSRLQALRFIGALDKSGGDEAVAIEKFTR